MAECERRYKIEQLHNMEEKEKAERKVKIDEEKLQLIKSRHEQAQAALAAKINAAAVEVNRLTDERDMLRQTMQERLRYVAGSLVHLKVRNRGNLVQRSAHV